MNVKNLLSVCNDYRYGINKIKIIADTMEAKKLLASDEGVVMHSITIPIQKAREDDSISEMTILKIGIEDIDTILIII